MTEDTPSSAAGGTVDRDIAGSPYLAQYAGTGDSVLIDGDRTAGRLAVVVRELTAGTTAPRRRHAVEDLVYLVLEGEVELEVAGRSWILTSLASLHCPPAVPHRYRALTDARLVVLAVPGGAEQLLLHGDRIAQEDPALLLAIAQEHSVDVLPGLLP